MRNASYLPRSWHRPTAEAVVVCLPSGSTECHALRLFWGFLASCCPGSRRLVADQPTLETLALDGPPCAGSRRLEGSPAVWQAPEPQRWCVYLSAALRGVAEDLAAGFEDDAGRIASLSKQFCDSRARASNACVRRRGHEIWPGLDSHWSSIGQCTLRDPASQKRKVSYRDLPALVLASPALSRE
jgi:hypothetical protein